MSCIGGSLIKNNLDILAGMLNKLNNCNNINAVLPEIFTELCNYLNFGCGFYYQVNYEKTFFLKEKTSLYIDDVLPEALDIFLMLCKEDLDVLKRDKYIFYRSSEPDANNLVGKKLAYLLSTKSLILVPIFNDDEEISGLVGISDRRGNVRTDKEDFTLAHTIMNTICNYLKLQQVRERLDTTKNALQRVTDNMGVDIYVNDFYTHEILYANSSMAEPYGGVDELVGKTCWEALYDDKNEQCDYCPQKEIIDENGNPTRIYNWDYQRPFDGSWFKVINSAFQWIDGRLAHIVSSIDITENKNNEKIIQQMALYDHLTGLPNRYKLTEDLDEMIPALEYDNNGGFVIFFDLDGFKNINDTMGHHTGDQVLMRIAELLQGNEFINGKCYRYGGDEFVILCYGQNANFIKNILCFLKNVFTKLILVEGRPIKCGASIGISHYPTDDIKTSELIRKADQAMYMSKDRENSMMHFYNEGDIVSYD